MARLTAKYIEALQRKVGKGERVPEWHPDGDGLYLRVRASGFISFEGRRGGFKPFPIGPLAIGLAGAREVWREALVMQARGIDPAVKKKVEREEARAQSRPAGDTFEKILDRFVERRCKPNLRTWADVDRVLKREAAPKWFGVRIGQITKAEIRDVLDAIVDRGAPRQATLVYAYLNTLFVWAIGRGYLDKNPIEGLPRPSKSQSRERALDDRELALVWRAAEDAGYPFGPIVRMLILTGQRKSEIADGNWREIDIAGAMWRLPAARVKNKQAHEFPLSQLALSIIDGLPRIDGRDLVFTSTGRTPVSGFSRAKDNLDAAVTELNGGEMIAPWTFHDLRRTCATGLAKLGVAPHVVEAVLNHRSGSKKGVAGIYNRHDYTAEKRRALDAWAAHVERIATGAAATNVIELRRTGA